MAPLIFKKQIQLPPATDNDRRAYDQRIKDSLGLDTIALPLSVLKQISPQIRSGGPLTCIIGRTDAGHKLIDTSAGSYAIAIDLGTTNLALLLYDNLSQSDVLSMNFENPQITFGSDILTRMQAAMSGNDEVYTVLKDGINRAIGTVCEKAGIARRDIHAVVAAGNTVMTHFFLGLDISTIPVEPFVPLVRTPGFFTGNDLALAVNPEALVYVFPNAGSYVGGDIVAGIIAAGIDRADSAAVLIDVGTNAEVVIGNKEWMLVGAGAAGPALEEGIARIGKRASKGIIYDVEIENGSVLCKTFDDERPEGICGSGMVSLLHALYHAGIIDPTGIFIERGEKVVTVDGEQAYMVDCGRGPALVIRQSEILNFMKSKAAMFTLLLVLTRSVGIAFKDISHVYIAGALGTGIDARKAVGIGMIPAWPQTSTKALGNASLKGTRMLLADGNLISRINAVTAMVTYKHMHDDPEFMREYLGAVFIPHTNPELLNAS